MLPQQFAFANKSFTLALVLSVTSLILILHNYVWGSEGTEMFIAFACLFLFAFISPFLQLTKKQYQKKMVVVDLFLLVFLYFDMSIYLLIFSKCSLLHDFLLIKYNLYIWSIFLVLTLITTLVIIVRKRKIP